MNKQKHLEMIENVIERMSKNSFQLKGWAVTLASFIITLSVDKNSFSAVMVAVPLLAFWCLDAYYLQLERIYRELYKIVCAKDDETIDFCMDISYFVKKGTYLSFFNCLKARTEAGFYLPVAAAMALLIILIK